jgi:hypothetical protein
MGAGRRARRTTIDALRGRLRVRAGHNLPILVTVAGPGPIRFAGAAARTALTSFGPRASVTVDVGRMWVCGFER